MNISNNCTEKPLKLFKRGGFSERIDLINMNNIIQKDELDERTRIIIYNNTSDIFTFVENNIYSKYKSFIEYLYCDLLSKKNTEIPYRNSYNGVYLDKIIIMDLLSEIFLNHHYGDVLTLVESIVEFFKGVYGAPDVQKIYNNIFNNECVGYRIIDGKITDIIDKCEIKEIEQAINNSNYSYSKHINKSIELLFDRDHPDYENSIKESITAVESLCREYTGESTLGKALNKLENKGISIHPTLKNAFENLFAYTNTAKGVRHSGGLDSPKASFEEAKFMLISCSAFTNYLLVVNSKK